MKLKDFIEAYKEETVQISERVSYDQRDIIDKNHQMRNGQYEEKYFADGETEKYYYNVIFGFDQALKRGSRLKISEFSLTSTNGKFLKMIDILKMGLKHFLKYNGFIDKKEEVLDELTAMGHVLTKVVDGDASVVDLRNVVFRPNARSLKDEGCAEDVYLTYDEAKAEYGDNEHWEEIEESYEISRKESPFLKFIEYWTIDDFKDEKGNEIITKGCIKHFEKSKDDPEEAKDPDTWDPYLELERFISPHKVKCANKRDKKIFGKEKRVFPYDEQRLIVVAGRYMGMGVYEACRPSQEDYNEKRNLKRKFDRIALRGILVHKIGKIRQDTDGEALTQEFLKRVDTGAAIKIFDDETLDRLNIGSTTSDTLAMTNDLFEFIRFMLGVVPIAVGDDPKNKTASFAMIQNQNQQSTYLVIKNKTARLFERLFQDFLLDDVVDEILTGDTIALYGDPEDFKEMDRFLAENEVQTILNKVKPKTSKEEIDQAVQQRVDQNERFGAQSRFIDVSDKLVKKAFRKLLKEIQYLVEFNITDEAIDNATKIDTLLKADQMQNMKLRDRVLDLIGISPKELKESDAEKQRALEAEVKKEALLTQAKTPIEQGVPNPGMPSSPQVQQL